MVFSILSSHKPRKWRRLDNFDGFVIIRGRATEDCGRMIPNLENLAGLDRDRVPPGYGTRAVDSTQCTSENFLLDISFNSIFINYVIVDVLFQAVQMFVHFLVFSIF